MVPRDFIPQIEKMIAVLEKRAAYCESYAAEYETDNQPIKASEYREDAQRCRNAAKLQRESLDALSDK
jgi:hypothetical protein